METPCFSLLSDREEICLQGFRIGGLAINTGGTAVGLARTEDKFVDRIHETLLEDTDIQSVCVM